MQDKIIQPDQMSQSKQKVNIYYSCAEKDRKFRDGLDRQLAVLQQRGLITIWYDNLIGAGFPTNQEKALYWKQAQIIILLISPDYLKTCYAQMEAAIQRYQAGAARIIPVLLRPTSNWKQTPLGEFKLLPADDRSISEWRNRDVAFARVADEICRVVEQLTDQQRRVQSSSRLLLDMPPSHIHSTILPRDVLVREIATKLLQPDISALILTGIAGIGKSQLASQLYHYMEQQRLAGIGHFTHGALWLRIRPTTTVEDLISTLSPELNSSPWRREHLSPQELALEFVDLLNDAHNCRLIVLDNFEEWLDMQGDVLTKALVIDECLALLNERPSASRILITSRIKPRARRPYKQMYLQEMPLEGLSQEEGVTLLRLWDIQATKSDLEHAVASCQGHAMALVLLDQLLRTHKVSLATLLNDPAYRHLWAWDVEHNLFNDLYESYNEQQRMLLQAFSTYREAVPFGAACAIARQVASMTERQAIQIIGLLLTQGLLLAHSSSKERYELHPLVAEFVRARLLDEQQSADRDRQHLHTAAAHYYQDQFPSQRQLRRRRLGMDDVHPLIEAIWHYCQDEQWQVAYELMVQEHLFTDLLRWGEYTVLLELYTLLSSSASWQSEILHAQILNEMGEIYNGLGRKEEALTSFDKALDLYRKVGSQPEIVRALNNAGSIQRVCGDMDLAFKYYHEAMDICTQTQEPVEKGITLNNLGHAYQSLGIAEQTAKWRIRNYDQALLYYQQAFAIHQAAGDRAEIGRTLNNMGEVYEGLEKWEQAKEHYRQALEHLQAVQERRSEGIVGNNLGTLYRKIDQKEDAFEYYTWALRIFRNIGARWEEAVVLKNLGRLYVLLQRMDVALAFFLLARDIYEALHYPERGIIPRGLQIVLAGEQSFEDAVAEIYPRAYELVAQAIEGDML